MGRHWTASYLLLLGCVTVAFSQEQIPAPPLDLAASARAAKDSFRPTSPEQLQAARARLQDDVARLDRFLGKGANGQAWRKFLMWDQLQAQLAPDAMPEIA